MLAQHPDTSDRAKAAVKEVLERIPLLSLEEKTALDTALGKTDEALESGLFSGTHQLLLEQFTSMTSTSAKVTASASQVSPQRPKIPPSPLAPFTQVDVSQNLAPQNEPSIAVNPLKPGNLIASSNDYRLSTSAGTTPGIDMRKDVAHCGRYVSHDNGQSWSVGIAESNGFFGADPSVAFDSQGNAYLSCIFFRQVPMGLFFELVSGVEVSKSTDGGRTWSFPVIVEEGPPPLIDPTQIANGFRFEFKAGGEGAYIAAGPPAGPDGNAVYISERSLDTILEMTFSPFTFLLEVTSQITLDRSPDGVTWSGPIAVSPTAIFERISFPPFDFQFPRHLVSGAKPWVSSDGNLDVFWYDSLENPPPYFPFRGGWLVGEFETKVSRSTDGAMTFGDVHTIARKTQVSGGIFPSSFHLRPTLFGGWESMHPVVRTDPRDSNRVYAVFAADPEPFPGFPLPPGYIESVIAGDNSDIFFSRSVDGGTTWAAPIRVNDDTTLNDQFYPWMTVQPDGTIWISFADRREDPRNTRYDVFITASTDGGISIKPNMKITSGPSDPNTQFLGFFMGDYFGLASDSSHIYASWTDTRFQGSQDIWVGVAQSGRLLGQPPP